MKTKHTIIALLFFVSTGLYAQTSHIKEIEIKNQRVEKQENHISIAMDMVLDNLTLGANEMLTLTPVIQSADAHEKTELAPVVINGATRQKVFNRSRKLNNTPAFAVEPLTVLRRDNNKSQTVNYSVTVARQAWMKNAQLILKKHVTGCAQCDRGSAEQLLSQRILPADFVPVYRVAYITPKAEPVKRRSDKYSASFSYKVGRWELLPDFGNNAAELAAVGKVMSEIKGNKDLSITDLTVSGYASPEGSYDSNLKLSQNRAQTFADYLSKTYGIAQNRMKVVWFGEDWAGLRKAVEASTIQDRDAVLKLIDEVDIHKGREKQLMDLSGGATYKILLNDYFPSLRRNEYAVAYIARAFDVNEAKAIIKTKPQLLSLNEMFLVAQTYAKESAEFKEVFDIAARLYPQDPVTNLNAAAAELEGGNTDAAIARLEKFEKMPEAWNNLGVAYARKRNFEKAQAYLAKAAAKGDADAVNNMEQLQKLREDAE